MRAIEHLKLCPLDELLNGFTLSYDRNMYMMSRERGNMFNLVNHVGFEFYRLVLAATLSHNTKINGNGVWFGDMRIFYDQLGAYCAALDFEKKNEIST